MVEKLQEACNASASWRGMRSDGWRERGSSLGAAAAAGSKRCEPERATEPRVLGFYDFKAFEKKDGGTGRAVWLGSGRPAVHGINGELYGIQVPCTLFFLILFFALLKIGWWCWCQIPAFTIEEGLQNKFFD